MVCFLSDLQHTIPSALLFSLLDLDLSFLQFSKGHMLHTHTINLLVACGSRPS